MERFIKRMKWEIGVVVALGRCPSGEDFDYLWKSAYEVHYFFFFSSRRRHTRSDRDWSSDVCSSDLSMRVWLDPDKLQSRNLTAGDVVRVLREQNIQVAAGQIGQPPIPTGQDFQYTLSTLGRLVEAEQFANIILKTGANGEVTYLKDVARTELGARSQDTLARLDGRPTA